MSDQRSKLEQIGVFNGVIVGRGLRGYVYAALPTRDGSVRACSMIRLGSLPAPGPTPRCLNRVVFGAACKRPISREQRTNSNDRVWLFCTDTSLYFCEDCQRGCSSA